MLNGTPSADIGFPNNPRWNFKAHDKLRGEVRVEIYTDFTVTYCFFSTTC